MPSNQPEGERREGREGEHTVWEEEGGEEETHVAGIIGPGEEHGIESEGRNFFLRFTVKEFKRYKDHIIIKHTTDAFK